MRMSRIAFAARFAQIVPGFEVMELSPQPGCGLIRISSHIVELSHEAKLPVRARCWFGSNESRTM